MRQRSQQLQSDLITVVIFADYTKGTIKMINNVADLADPSDKQGRSYRQINNEKTHNFKVGQLIELECGARLHVLKHSRDCDGTPLYVIGLKESNIVEGGYPEDYLKAI